MQYFIKRCFDFLYKRINPQTTTQTADISILKSEEIPAVKPNSQQINELMVLFNGGRYVETAALAQILTARFPHNGFVWNALAISLQMQGKDGLLAMKNAAELLPGDAEVQHNLGIIFTNLGQFNHALASYRRALDIKPDFADAHRNLGDTLLRLGQFDEAMASYYRALEIQPDHVDAYSSLLFNQNYQSNQPAALLFETARRFGELLARQAQPYTSWHSAPDSDRYLRVGLVSGDLRNHPVGYFIESILAAFASKVSNNASRLKFVVYYNQSYSDALTQRIQACCHEWHAVFKLTDQSLAQQIHDDKIDILIDLSGHSDYNRLPMFSYKPAPVQLTWLGYFATTAMTSIDYLLADPWVLPKEQEIYFTEKIWRLPETRLCFSEPDIVVDVSSLPALSNKYITFGCFNNLSKMNDDVVALWAKILTSIPDSRLFLKAKQFDQISAQQETITRFSKYGISANRLILQGAESREKYLVAYHQVDIALDPFPFPGGTTSVEGLWMGVPVLTLAGERFLSRQGVGILMNAGLADWIASDADDYVARAVAHASDVQALSDLRGGLRQQVLSSPLFDAKSFATHFEAALQAMWQQHLNTVHCVK